MSNETVLVEDRGPIRIITLNRPERLNAVSPELIADFHRTLEEAQSDFSFGTIILTGAGGSFCSGDDLREKDPLPQDGEQGLELVDTLQDISRLMVLGNKMMIGAVSGWAVGAGFEWAVNCDYSIWAEDAKAFCPEMKWGMSPTGGVTALLPKIVGLNKAREILMLGDRLGAPDLHSAGLAYRVVPESRVMAEALELGERIAAFPPRAIRDLKRAMSVVMEDELERALKLETESIINAVRDPETARLLGAFSESST